MSAWTRSILNDMMVPLLILVVGFVAFVLWMLALVASAALWPTNV